MFGYIANEIGATGATYTVSNNNGTTGSYILLQFIGGNGRGKKNFFKFIYKRISIIEYS